MPNDRPSGWAWFDSGNQNLILFSIFSADVRFECERYPYVMNSQYRDKILYSEAGRRFVRNQPQVYRIVVATFPDWPGVAG